MTRPRELAAMPPLDPTAPNAQVIHDMVAWQVGRQTCDSEVAGFVSQFGIRHLATLGMLFHSRACLQAVSSGTGQRAVMTYSCEGDSGSGREYWQLPLGLMTNITNGLSAVRPG